MFEQRSDFVGPNVEKVPAKTPSLTPNQSGQPITDANLTRRSNLKPASSPKKKVDIIDVHLDDERIAAARKRAGEILKLDKDPIKAIQKALSMPKYAGYAGIAQKSDGTERKAERTH